MSYNNLFFANANTSTKMQDSFGIGHEECTFEPPRRKTNNVVSEQVRHKPGCTRTEDG